jgi:hypothetical protein
MAPLYKTHWGLQAMSDATSRKHSWRDDSGGGTAITISTARACPVVLSLRIRACSDLRSCLAPSCRLGAGT